MTQTYPIDATRARFGRRAALRQLFALLAVGTSFGAGALGRAWGAAPPPPPPPPPPGWPPNKTVQGGVTVSPNDPAISAQAVQYPGAPVGTVLGYLSTPVGAQVYPGILVLHDALGLTEHIRDVTRRLARIGYVALAPDLLSTLGGTEKVGSIANILTALQNISQFDLLSIGNVSVRYLEAQPLVAKTRIGVLGFGFGANLGWELLVSDEDIKVGVVFDSPTPDPTVATQFSKPTLAIYGADDTVDSEGVKELDDAMKKAGVPWQYKLEPKANRAFFDDSRTPYVPDAAKDAWKLTTDWLTKYLAAT
jgi:carboxymethylenebutenolidase